jgi:hypothetical protein
MKRSAANLLCILALLALAHVPSLHAQAVGTITGIVTDPSGAVIPGARITAIRTETGVSQSTITTSAGTYTIPNLVVGSYNVSAEAQGFANAAANGITLDVAQQRQVDFKLAVSGVSARVEVSAAPPLLNTTEGSLAGLVTGSQVQSLPLNGRSIANLVMLQPGMAQDSGEMGWFAPEWVGNGNRAETAVALLDGSDSSDREMGTVQFWDFNLDAIAEFKVQQNNYSAQYGQGGGTITQIVSKTGTNQFHGSAFEFVRNNDFDTRNFFGATVPPLQRNEFGFTFGGPIKRDKTFFFGEYAGFRQLSGEPTFMSVPTAAERQGQVTVADPVIPSFQDQLQVPLNSAAQTVLGKYPMPNEPNGPLGANTYNVLFKQPTNYNQFSVRLDQHISDKDSFFARASYINHNAFETDPVAAVENPSYSQTNFNNPRNYSMSETHIFSPTLMNVFSFTLNRQIEGVKPPTQAYTQTTFSDGSLANYGPDTFITKYNETYFEPTDSVTWTRGRHTFNLGGKYERGWDNVSGVTGVGPNGVFSFAPGTALLSAIPSTNGGTSLAAGSASPNGLVSMMEGDPQFYGRALAIPGYGPPGGGTTWGGIRVWHLAGWVQDDIKVTPKLTVNAGLRYEYNAVPTEVASRLSQPGDTGSLYGRMVLNPHPFYQPDYNNFGPRLGVAYRATGKTVLRGGFGIFSNMLPIVIPDETLVDFPMASLSYLYPSPGHPVTYSFTPLPVTLPPLTSLSGAVMPPNGNTKLIPPNTPVNLAAIANVTGPISGTFATDRMLNGYTMNGNATVEHEFPGSVDVQVSYVANNGVHISNSMYPNSYTGAEPQNAPYSQLNPGLTPGTTGIGELENFYSGAYSSYNALQAQLRKNSPSHGIQFQADYTWGKDMTEADAIWGSAAPFASGGVSLANPNCLKCERAPATYSINQRFVANFQYELPFARAHSLPRRLTEGWKALGILTVQSGAPFTVVGPYGTLAYGFDTFNGVGTRPFFLQKATRSSTLTPGTGPQFFSSQVIGLGEGPGGTSLSGMGTGYFGVPTTTSPYYGGAVVQTAPGNLGRNTFTAPSWSNLDFSLIKDTRITESMSLQFRAEFFNVLNEATFALPFIGGANETLSNPYFGLLTNTATPERQIQFGVRLMF